MFEDIKKEPEDMFDATDTVAPQVTPPTDLPASPPVAAGGVPEVPVSRAQEPMISGSPSRGGFPWRGIVLVVCVLVVITVAFLLSMKVLGSRTPVTPEPPVQEQVESAAAKAMADKEVEQVEKVDEVGEVEEVSEPEVSRKDTDKDGLTDEEEKEYGTSTTTADTDSDGLFDPEEIKTWETDPLNPDTDGDGYLDGAEVDGGYNPNGAGALREAPTESS